MEGRKGGRFDGIGVNELLCTTALRCPLQGYKFDLRLYVAVTSFNPLEAWICSEGFARFATLPFVLDQDQHGNM